MKLCWSPRAQPLAVEGCWAEGAAADELQGKINRRGLKFQMVRFEDGLAVLGSEVPWVDGGVFFFFLRPIYMPTMWQPQLPHEWLVAGLSKQSAGPWILLQDDRLLSLP